MAGGSLDPLLTRRQLLRSALLASSVCALPRWSWAGSGPVAPPIGFLQPDELLIADAFTGRILPSGDTVGAREAGVVNYIQRLLSALPALDPNADGRRSAADLTHVATRLGTADPGSDADGDGVVTANDLRLVTAAIFDGTPGDVTWPARQAIHAGGPFSDRNPFPDPSTGTPSSTFPPNSFGDSIPLPRVKRLAWTVRLLGAGAVPEVAGNPLARTQPDVNMRSRYRAGLQLTDTIALDRFGTSFVQLTAAEQDEVIDALRVHPQGASFLNLITVHTVEGFLCAPEYGGNRNGVGWRLVGFDGDSQPLGYTIFDESTQSYRERDDKPNSRPDPGETCEGLSEDMLDFLRIIFLQLTPGGMEYRDPFCFGVDR
jgi:hypothetical protein